MSLAGLGLACVLGREGGNERTDEYENARGNRAVTGARRAASRPPRAPYNREQQREGGTEHREKRRRRGKARGAGAVLCAGTAGGRGPTMAGWWGEPRTEEKGENSGPTIDRTTTVGKGDTETSEGAKGTKGGKGYQSREELPWTEGHTRALQLHKYTQ